MNPKLKMPNLQNENTDSLTNIQFTFNCHKSNNRDIKKEFNDEEQSH